MSPASTDLLPPVKLPTENSVPELPDDTVHSKAPATDVPFTSIAKAEGALELDATEGLANVGDEAFHVTEARKEDPPPVVYAVPGTNSVQVACDASVSPAA